MLPTNPRSGVQGLPTNPRPRSRSTGRSISNRETTNPSPSNNQTRLPYQTSRLRPSRALESTTQNQTHSRTSSSPIGSHVPHKSDGSTSSSGSSLLSRMKLGTAYTSGSSRTSFEDADQSYPKEQPIKHDELLTSHRQTGNARERPISNNNEDQSAFSLNVSDGSALWSRVATVASTLTVSVSKAWAANVPTYSGEETPPGQESRLTRAMKAYHLAKAKDPTDLPPWLFDEATRRRPNPISIHDDNGDEYQTRQGLPNATAKPRGLRDVYDAATSVPYTSMMGPTRGRSRINDTEETSKAADRLKAIREAKRNANAAPRHLPDNQSVTHKDDGKYKVDRRAPRVGLPARPQRM